MQSSSNKSTFYLASASKRIFVKLLEYLILTGINILISFLFTFKTINWSNSELIGDSWVFSLAISFSFVANFLIWFSYFCLIPYFFKGYTLFYKIFKLKLHASSKEKWKLINLFKREIFIWVPIFLVGWIMTLVSFAFNDPILFFSQIISFNQLNNSSTAIKVTSAIFCFLYIICSLPTLGIIINTISNSNDLTIIDNYSKISVIDLSSKVEQKTKEIKNKKSDLPGIIDEIELEKI